MSVVVRYAVLGAEQVLNLAGPDRLPEVFRAFRPVRVGQWHTADLDPFRQVVAEAYVASFNRRTGHYDRLLESVAREGFRNPVIASAGGLDRRSPEEVPPGTPESTPVVEYLGGSRVWAAGALGVPVPVLVNDRTLGEPSAPGVALASPRDASGHFKDAPSSVSVRSDGGVEVSGLPYTHFPLHARYGVSEQVVIRRKVLDDVWVAADRWLLDHSLPCLRAPWWNR